MPEATSTTTTTTPASSSVVASDVVALHGFLASCLEELQDVLRKAQQHKPTTPSLVTPSSPPSASSPLSPLMQQTQQERSKQKYARPPDPKLFMGRARNLVVAMRERLLGVVGSSSGLAT